jgi:hypothetical protein
MAKKPTFDGYPFYTITRGGPNNERIDSAKAYLSPFCVVQVELFDTSPRIELELPHKGQHEAPKWKPSERYNWYEEACTAEEFLKHYNQVQEQIKRLFKKPSTMSRHDAFMASLSSAYPSQN